MKTNGILPISRILIVSLFSILSFNTGFAQPDYTFKNSTLQSGTDLEVGAVYLFKNVKTGVDARVTIMNITGGISLTDIDGPGGFVEALQPVLTVPGLANGYVEFRIDFYVANTLVPLIQVEIPITPIDVDGAKYSGMPLYEFDEVKNLTGYTMYQMVGGQLTMSKSGSWTRGKNNTAIDYPGIDTVQKEVMFTSVNAGISSLSVRVGADNTSNTSASRLRSFYFKKFTYDHQGILSVNSLTNFSGIAQDNRVELQYELNEPSKVLEVIAERAGADMSFAFFSKMTINEEQSKYRLYDTYAGDIGFYRLKLVYTSGEISYSNVLRFENRNKSKVNFKVYPSVVNDQATVQFQSLSDENVMIQITDFTGRVVYSKNNVVQKGFNNFSVNGLGGLGAGNYVLTVRKGKELLQQKIIKM